MLKGEGQKFIKGEDGAAGTAIFAPFKEDFDADSTDSYDPEEYAVIGEE